MWSRRQFWGRKLGKYRQCLVPPLPDGRTHAHTTSLFLTFTSSSQQVLITLTRNRSESRFGGPGDRFRAGSRYVYDSEYVNMIYLSST